MKKYSLKYHYNTHKYLGNHPEEETPDYSENVQGITHDTNHWYITNDKKIFKYHVAADLATNKYTEKKGIPHSLLEAGYDKFKTIDCFNSVLYIPMNYNYGYLVNQAFYSGPEVLSKIPEEKPPIVALFDAETLDFIGCVELLMPHNNVSCAGINPVNSLLYVTTSKVSPENPIYIYNIKVNRELKSMSCEPNGQLILNTPYLLKSMQGLTFSPDGLLYLVNGYFDSMEGTINPLEGFVEVSPFNKSRAGISVYDGLDDYVFIDKSTQKGSFRYQWDADWKIAEEPEGLTFWDLDADTRAPGIDGQLHVLLLDNDKPDGDDVYIKHYRISDPIPRIYPYLNLWHKYNETSDNSLLAINGEMNPNIKGMTQDGNFFYFVVNNELIKVNPDFKLQEFKNLDVCTGIAERISLKRHLTQEYSSIGAIACDNGTLYIPFYESGKKPVVAFYNSLNLTYISYAEIDDMNDISWCGVNPLDKNNIYISDRTGKVCSYSFTRTSDNIRFKKNKEIKFTGYSSESFSFNLISGGAVCQKSGLIYLVHEGSISVLQTDGSLVDTMVDQDGKSFYKPVRKTFEKAVLLTVHDSSQNIEGDVSVLFCDNMGNYTLESFKRLKAKYIGNKKTKELHVDGCSFLKRMLKKNKINFDFAEKAISFGYDGCYYCMKDLNTR